MENNICYSGGAIGADKVWGDNARLNGHKVIHFMFHGHKGSNAPDVTIVKPEDLLAADPYLAAANKVLKRSWPAHSDFVSNLLRRNYWQINDTDAVYAVANLKDNTVTGGTAWAVEMFKLKYPNSDQIFVFDQESEKWYQWNFMSWIVIDKPPIPSGKWTGIGSRELSEASIEAIINTFVD